MVVLSTIPPQTRYSASWPVDLSSGVVSHTSTTSIKESLQTKPTDAQKLKIIMEEITRVANSLSRHGFAIPEGEVKLDTLLWDSDGIKGYFDDSTGITDLLLSLDKRIPGFNFYKHLPTNATPQSILDITNGKVRIGTLGEGHGRLVLDGNGWYLSWSNGYV